MRAPTDACRCGYTEQRNVRRGLHGAEMHSWGVARGRWVSGMLCGGVRVLGMSPRRDFLVVRAGAARAARLAVRGCSCVLLGLLLGAVSCAKLRWPMNMEEIAQEAQ